MSWLTTPVRHIFRMPVACWLLTIIYKRARVRPAVDMISASFVRHEQLARLWATMHRIVRVSQNMPDRALVDTLWNLVSPPSRGSHLSVPRGPQSDFQSKNKKKTLYYSHTKVGGEDTKLYGELSVLYRCIFVWGWNLRAQLGGYIAVLLIPQLAAHLTRYTREWRYLNLL